MEDESITDKILTYTNIQPTCFDFNNKMLNLGLYVNIVSPYKIMNHCMTQNGAFP